MRRARGRSGLAQCAALALLFGCGAPGTNLSGAPARPSDPNCGLSPSDWCTAAVAGDACSVHPNEKACRADPRCRGLPYRGESFVACQPDGKGFWTNCPAVGCVLRSDPPGQPPRADVVVQLCGSNALGGDDAEIRVWRTPENATSVLELRASRLPARSPALYYDAAGRQLLALPSDQVMGGSDLGRHLAPMRASVLAGLEQAETVRCPRRK